MTKKQKRTDTTRTPPRPLSLRHADGSVQTFTPRLPAGADEIKMNMARVVSYATFKLCPICLSAPATHREHVPPEALGGQRLLRTCEPCNIRLGGYLEGDLASWYDGSFRMAFSSAAIQGKRKFAKTRIMLTDDGGFVILADDPTHQAANAWAEAAAHGDVAVEASFGYSINRACLGLLKSVYLTACLDMGGPPAGVVADKVRRELVSARNAPSREAVPSSELALGLRVARSHDGQRGTNAAAAIAYSSSPAGPRWGALLVGSIFIEFPPGFPVAGINQTSD